MAFPEIHQNPLLFVGLNKWQRPYLAARPPINPLGTDCAMIAYFPVFMSPRTEEGHYEYHRVTMSVSLSETLTTKHLGFAIVVFSTSL